ncbi:MAG: hypothetical protein HRU34_22510 [Richelia sp.]|nr:hypothetical protein [Richelia sp.]CDN13515.1 Mobile element protein [Richelia intracellularis]
MRDDFTKFSTIYQCFQTLIHTGLMQRRKYFVFEKITQPTAIQQRAIDLLGISMICTQ